MTDLSRLDPYIKLIESFVDGSLEAVEFERSYIDLYTDDPTMWDARTFEVLDRLFADVDAFCADPALRDSEDLDPRQLQASASEALKRLRALSSFPPGKIRL